MKISSPDLKDAFFKIAIVVLCISIGWYLKGRLSPSAGMPGFGMGEVYVLAKKAEVKDISSVDNKISYVESINEVNLLSKVTGTIEEVLFQEGGLVNEGDVLFQIDPSKYQAAFDLAKARLDSAQANFVKAERDYKRQVQLSQQKFASKATFDMSESAYLQAKAAVEEAKANLDVATIDLDNTKIVAPISGRIGKALVTKGNYVVASSQVLAKIVQISPMRVTFSLTDKEALTIQQNSTKPNDITARITLPTADIVEEQVVDIFFDNEINPSTATVSIYADVPNTKNLLIPGNYVQTALLTGEKVMSTVVPQTAINYDKEGAFVYVVKVNPEKSAENDMHGVADQRRVVLGDVVGETNQAVVSGLNEGELVVVQGTVKIQNNSPIKIGVLEN